MGSAKLDHKIISDIIEPQSRVLDLGCGRGELLSLLVEKKACRVQGVELNEAAIYACVESGLTVHHADIESGLADYPDKSFDYAILNQSLQEVKNVILVIDEALRAAKKVIVGFPNFAYYPARLRMFFSGKAPVTRSLPYRWYDTPNLHFLSTTDFDDFCKERGIIILARYYLGQKDEIRVLPNLLALNAIFVITKKSNKA